MIARGEIYLAALDPVVGSEQGGVRPVLIIQNNVGNRFSPTVIVLAITSQLGKARLPTHVEMPAQGHGLNRTRWRSPSKFVPWISADCGNIWVVCPKRL